MDAVNLHGSNKSVAFDRIAELENDFSKVSDSCEQLDLLSVAKH